MSIWYTVFDACVLALQWLAAWLDPIWPGGMDYVKVNVIVFCVCLPIVLATSLGLNVWLIVKVRRKRLWWRRES